MAISEEHSDELLRILLDKPDADDGDVRDAVSSRLRQDHPDDAELEGHIRWRRRGIYAICRMLEQQGRARPSLDDVNAADGVKHWARVYWILVNFPDLRSKSAADVGSRRTWKDSGYAPMAKVVLAELGGAAAKERRDRIAEALAVRLKQEKKEEVERQISKLMALGSS